MRQDAKAAKRREWAAQIVQDVLEMQTSGMYLEDGMVDVVASLLHGYLSSVHTPARKPRRKPVTPRRSSRA